MFVPFLNVFYELEIKMCLLRSPSVGNDTDWPASASQENPLPDSRHEMLTKSCPARDWAGGDTKAGPVHEN